MEDQAPSAIPPTLRAWVRGTANMIAGGLATNGIIASDHQQVAVAIIIGIVTFAFSAYEKWHHKKALAAAIAAPAGKAA